MPTRNNTFSPLGGTTRSGATNFAPLPVYDFAPAINQQMKFFTDLQRMYARQQGDAAQGQLEIIGTNPETGEPIYANVAGKNKDARTASKEIIARDLMKKGLESDAAYQKAKAELYSGNPLSAQRQNELVKVMRGRVDEWGKNLGINKRDAFYNAFGDAEQKAKDAAQAVEDSGKLDALGAGLRMGWNTLKGMARQIGNIGDPEGRLQAGRETAEANRKIMEENADLRETMLRQQEAAAQGKELGFWDATRGNRWDNIVAQAANMATTFAPAIGATALTGGIAAPAVVGGITGAAMNAEAMAERAAEDANLTEQQKIDALSSLSALGNVVAGGAAGAFVPGQVVNKATQVIGRGAAASAFRAAQAAGTPVREALQQGVRGSLRQMGKNAAARAVAPRTLGRVAGDIAVNAGENAGIMAANQLAMNALYGAATGQDVPLTEGVTESAITGAALGIPFGLARGMHRSRPASTATPRADASAAASDNPTSTAPSGDGVNAMFGNGKATKDAIVQLASPNKKTFKAQFEQAVDMGRTVSVDPENAVRRFGGLTPDEIRSIRSTEGFKNFWNELREAMSTDTPEAVEKQNSLIAEYIKGRGDNALRELDAIRLSSLKDSIISAEIGEGAKQMPRFAPIKDGAAWDTVSRTNLVKRLSEWNDAKLTREDIYAKANKYFPGEIRFADFMGEPHRAGAAEPAGANNRKNSSMAEDSAADASTTSTTSAEPTSGNTNTTESGGPRRAAQQGVGQDETASAATVPPGSFLGKAYAGSNVAGARAGSKQARASAGSAAGKTGGSASGRSDGAQAGGSEQSAGSARISTFSDGKKSYRDVDLGWIKLRKELDNPKAAWMFDDGAGRYAYVNTKNKSDWVKSYGQKLSKQEMNALIDHDISNMLIDNVAALSDPAGNTPSYTLSMDEMNAVFFPKENAPIPDTPDIPASITKLAQDFRSSQAAKNMQGLQEYLFARLDPDNTGNTVRSNSIYCGG